MDSSLDVRIAKKPFGGPQAVLAYLARYTHRVAIPPIKPMVLLQTSEQRARSDGATPNHLPLSRAW
jgi:hypothetical protein